MADAKSPAWREKGVLPVIGSAIAGFILSMCVIHCSVNGDPRPPQVVVFHSHTTDKAVGSWNLGDSLNVHFIGLAPVPKAFSPDMPWVPIEEVVMNRYPKLSVWAILACIMTAFASGCLPYFYSEWRRIVDAMAGETVWASAKWDIVSSVFLVGVLIALPLVLVGVWTPKDYVTILGTVFTSKWGFLFPVIANIICAGFGILWIGGIASRLRQLVPTVIDAAAEYASLRSSLQTALQLMALIVAFAVLTTAHLRMVIMDVLGVKAASPVFPIEFVHMYGLFFTAMLAIIYVPVHFLLRRAGEYVRVPVDDTPKATSTGIKGVVDSIAPGKGAWENMKAALSVLAPFLTVIIGKYIEHII